MNRALRIARLVVGGALAAVAVTTAHAAAVVAGPAERIGPGPCDPEGWLESLRMDYHANPDEDPDAGCMNEDCYWCWVHWDDADDEPPVKRG